MALLALAGLPVPATSRACLYHTNAESLFCLGPSCPSFGGYTIFDRVVVLLFLRAEAGVATLLSGLLRYWVRRLELYSTLQPAKSPFGLREKENKCHHLPSSLTIPVIKALSFARKFGVCRLGIKRIGIQASSFPSLLREPCPVSACLQRVSAGLRSPCCVASHPVRMRSLNGRRPISTEVSAPWRAGGEDRRTGRRSYPRGPQGREGTEPRVVVSVSKHHIRRTAGASAATSAGIWVMTLKTFLRCDYILC